MPWPFSTYLSPGDPVVQTINAKLQTINMNITEAIQQIKDAKEKLDKAKKEILEKIQSLIDVAGTLTPEQEDAVADLTTAAQALDDVVPDAPPVEPPTP